MSAPNRHVLIAGPTASGKSALALAFAERTGASIVNADALQVYRDWSVLTARPQTEDLNRAEHLLYGHVGFDTAYSVGDWLREIEVCLANGQRLIVVGGTGLYMTSLTQGLSEIPSTPEDLRQRGNDLYQSEGIAVFQTYLSTHDPAYFDIVDQNNHMRLQRAWEVQELTGKPMSWWRSQPKTVLLPLDRVLPLSLVSDPAWLNTRIAGRFDQMIGMGALDEVRANLDRWDDALPSSKALGARELRAHLLGEMSLEEAVERAKIATRQFAKRQRTWFRSNMGDWRQVEWDGSQVEEVVEGVGL